MCDLVRHSALGNKQVVRCHRSSLLAPVFSDFSFLNADLLRQDFKENFADPIRIGMTKDATMMQVRWF